MKLIFGRQQKILTIAIIGFGIIAILWIFIYIPQRKQLRALQQELSTIEDRIKSITPSSSQGELAFAVADLQKNLKQSQDLFITNERQLITVLSNAATHKNVNVTSIKPQPKTPLQGVDAAEGYACQEVPMSLTLTGEYRNIGEYIQALDHEVPIIITVRRLSIAGKGEGTYVLDAMLDVSAYLLQEANAS